MRLRFIYPINAPENGRLPEEQDLGYRLKYWMQAGVAAAEAGETAPVAQASFMKAAAGGFVLTIPPQHTLWIRQYKTASSMLPDTLLLERGDEHLVLTKEALQRRFRTHRARDLF